MQVILFIAVFNTVAHTCCTFISFAVDILSVSYKKLGLSKALYNQ